MHLRTNVSELFSTFIQFSDDRFDKWVSDWRLQKEVEKELAKADQASQPEEFWTLYWHKRWRGQTHPRAAAHLNAYLQEPCYWATYDITQRFNTLSLTLADGFQTAIAHTDRILKGYNPDYGNSLRGYARTAFGNIIRDQLRQQQDINICSDWGLLRRLSQAQLKRALLAAGLTQTEPDILAWQCFKAVCTPDIHRSVRAISPPTVEQFNKIAERYNHHRVRLSPMPPALETEDLVASLNQSVQAARAHLMLVVTSLNQPRFAQADPEWMDDLSSDDTPMERLLVAEDYAEQQQQMQQIERILIGEIANLNPADQFLLRLYYQETQTQSVIAQQLHIKQYQVSRQLSRIRQRLLINVARWSQEALHISLNSTVLASMSAVIHEWLQQHYQSAVESVDELGI